MESLIARAPRTGTLDRPEGSPRGVVAATPPAVMRRRGSEQQGRALEKLGHAVEYLVDSRMFLDLRSDARADREAIQILMRASRSVFAECPQQITVWERVERFCRRSFARR